jgi:hypothetical protein
MKGSTAFFISPEGLLFPVEGGNHISTIILNPSKFGVTAEQIERVYDFFEERVGVEGIARTQILIQLIRRGWIRLRRYPKSHWSVTVPALTSSVADLLQDWAGKFLAGFAGFREADPYMPVTITSPFRKLDGFSVKEVSQGALDNIAEGQTGATGIHLRFAKTAALLPNRLNEDESPTALEPRVGIFFVIDGVLIVESRTVSEGEDDGDFVNHSRSHYECWNRAVKRMRTTTAGGISGRSYDYYPRGRCLYSKKSKKFLLYLDPCIVRFPPKMQELLYKFQIPIEETDVVSDDPHYRCSGCNPRYLPDP